jgi:hypothetical protein
MPHQYASKQLLARLAAAGVGIYCQSSYRTRPWLAGLYARGQQTPASLAAFRVLAPSAGCC